MPPVPHLRRKATQQRASADRAAVEREIARQVTIAVAAAEKKAKREAEAELVAILVEANIKRPLKDVDA